MDFDPYGVQITKHALGQFVKRHEELCGSVPKDSEVTLRRLLYWSKPVERPTAMFALLEHGSRASYREEGGWYFVISEDDALVTVYRRNKGEMRWSRRKKFQDFYSPPSRKSQRQRVRSRH